MGLNLNNLHDIQNAIDEAENRYDRAKFLFLSGDMSKEKFELERNRKDEILHSLRSDNYNAIRALSNLIRQTLAEWDRPLAIRAREKDYFEWLSK
jgi:hypothetical protein